jgi:hypothetical protein
MHVKSLKANKKYFFLLSYSNDPSFWCRVDMSRKHIESWYLRNVLLRGTIILKMYQTTVILIRFFLLIKFDIFYIFRFMEIQYLHLIEIHSIQNFNFLI